MIDSKLLRADPSSIEKKLSKRGFKLDVGKLTELENQRKTLQIETENLQARRNDLSRQIGQLKSKKENADILLKEVNGIKDRLLINEERLNNVLASWKNMVLNIPNIPLNSVPDGFDENDNVEVFRFKEIPNFDFEIRDHMSIGGLNLDFEQGAQLSGARFVVMRNNIAKLHRSLSQFMLDMHTQDHGYMEINPPVLVKEHILQGTGQLPKFEEDLFKIEKEGEPLYLIPTSEVSLTNLVNDKILDVNMLPLKFTSHTLCFRSEAGSSGKDTRGMIRQHQFEKVELVQIVEASKSCEALEEITSHAEKILQLLDLPYRKMHLCSGDMGFSSQQTYDLEVWIPSQNKYREISSCSNCGDFQARRMNSRVRDSKKITLAHTLNGSGIAVGRALVAVLENYQQKDGTVKVPQVLRKYMNNLEFI